VIASIVHRLVTLDRSFLPFALAARIEAGLA
jgi:hypothetical protein